MKEKDERTIGKNDKRTFGKKGLKKRLREKDERNILKKRMKETF